MDKNTCNHMSPTNKEILKVSLLLFFTSLSLIRLRIIYKPVILIESFVGMQEVFIVRMVHLGTPPVVIHVIAHQGQDGLNCVN